MQRSSGLDVRQIIVVLAALVFAGSAFLPWVSVQGQDANSFDIPAKFLIDEAALDGFDLGYLVVGVGALAAVFGLMGQAVPRRAMGVAALAIVGLFAAQLGRSLEGSGIDATDVYGNALYAALIAGLVILVAPSSGSR